MQRQASFFTHLHPQSSVDKIWTELFLNVALSLIPIIFVAPVPVTLTCVVLIVLALGLHILNWRIPFFASLPFTLFFLVALKNILPRGAFSGDFFTLIFALLAITRTFNLRTYSHGAFLLIFTLGLNGTIILSDVDESPLVLIWSFACIIWTFGNLLRINLKDFSLKAILASLRSAAIATLYTLPLLFFLFYIFQKFSHMPIYFDRSDNVMGLSRSLEPGKVSRLASNATVALRVKMDQTDFLLEELYWKGTPLSESMGLKWGPLKNHKEFEPAVSEAGLPAACVIHQSIYVQRPEFLGIRFALDQPVYSTFHGTSPYTIASILCTTTQAIKMAPPDLQAYLRIEGRISPQVKRLVWQLKDKTQSHSEFISRLMHYFKANKFEYSLDLTPLSSSRNLDEFLFTTKKGFCEHYAAAAATLARLAGIPSRIVTGFQGGRYNKYGGYWIITNQDAHAWVEIWDDIRGWTRIDPTAIVAPNRIKLGGEAWLKTQKGYFNHLDLDSFWMIIDAFFFWVKSLFDHRSTLVSLDYVTLSPTLLSILLAMLVAWYFYRRWSQDPALEFRSQFKSLSQLLNQRVLPRGRAEGFEHYRLRLLESTRKSNLIEEINGVDLVLKNVIRYKYGKDPILSDQLRALTKEMRHLRWRFWTKTNLLYNFWKK